MEEKKKNFLPVLLTIVILMLLFAIVLFLFNKEGYLSFNKNNVTDCFNDRIVEDSNIITDNDAYSKAETNMTNDEIFDLWNKIKGNWAHIQFNNDTCAGNSLEINTYVKLAKFNSDGIITYRIISFNKTDDNKYELKLIAPVNLNDQMSGNTTASYMTLMIDMGEANDNKMNVKRGDAWVEYEYVGKNEVIVNENTKFQYIDGGFTQDHYCKWYKENH